MRRALQQSAVFAGFPLHDTDGFTRLLVPTPGSCTCLYQGSLRFTETRQIVRSKPKFEMGSAVEEFEDFNPCFFENATEDDFYDTPAPSEDIWKKFELLPTPPRSPKHEPFYAALNIPSTLEKLQLVSDILDDPMSKTIVFPEECTFQIKCKDTCCNLNINSKLIQDCMWSGHNILLGAASTDNLQTTRSTNLSSNIDINAPTDCVDPTAVFPYPVNGQTQRAHREQSRSLGTETPSDSGISDESDDEDDDEEIDVVTVADKVQMTVRTRRPVLPATPTASAQVAAMHNYTAAAPKSPKPEPSSCPRSPLSSQKRPRSSSHHSSQPSIKKLRITVPSHDQLRIVHKLSYKHHRSGNSSRSGSDSEEGGEGRRAQHNVLERKRRNDLKSSFQRLRDHVPDLNAQERAPKVTILKKATDYISLLRRRGNALVSEIERQKRTRDALQKRLRQLKSQ